MRDFKNKNRGRTTSHQGRSRNHGSSRRDTSWQGVAGRYNKIVGDKGHYFHQSVIVPKSLDLLNLDTSSSLLDLACGQGIFSRRIPKVNYYHGIDLSDSLIKFAKEQNKNINFLFDISDISEALPIKKTGFTHAVVILALQNIENFEGVIKNAAKHLTAGGKFLIVLNHPIFRIPRQTSWEIDEKNKIQYRRINRYLSPLKIPIDMAPGGYDTKLTWSFHNPISKYSEVLFNEGFLIEKIEEWVSDKQSVGKAATMENRARDEIPMFMAILAVKK
jgi:SAM-dependent methyltransferase